METFVAADSLDASLELLDDVDGFDLLLLDIEQVSDDISTGGDAPQCQDEAAEEPNGDLDVNPSKLISVNDANPTTEPVQTAPQKSTRKLRHQRKRNELEYLRNQVAELENELEELKTSRKSQNNGPRDEDEDAQRDVQQLWERVAENQRKERVKAEVANMKLREKVEGQLKIAKSLEKLLRKRPAEKAVDAKAQKIRGRSLAGLQESEIFELLSRRVDNLFEKVDPVMNEAGFAVKKYERNGAQVKFDDAGRVCLELVDGHISPFAVHDVAKAVWATLTTNRIALDHGYYKPLDCTDDTIRAEFCVTLQLRRAEALLRMRMLGKCMVREHQVVFVWATFGQTEGAPFAMQRINMSESGWTVVKSIADELSASNERTIVQSCIHLTPELEDSQKAHVGVLTDLVVGSYALNMQTMHQEVENHLVQDVLQ